MTVSVRIIGVRKDHGNHYDPHEAVTHYQWLNEQTKESKISDRPSMVTWVEGGGRAYASSTEGTVDCFVNRSAAGTKFLQTRADSRSSNNLLNLPEC